MYSPKLVTTCALLLALARTAAAAPDAAVLRAAWARDAATIAAHSGSVPVALEDGDFAVLGKGDLVARRVDTPQGAFAFGAAWLDVPIAAPWICIQDARDRPMVPSAVTTWLPGSTAQHPIVYIDLPLPWPISDRQWISDFRANHALFDATDGRVWQRSWNLADPALATASDPHAVWLPVNTGSWTMLAVSGGTLVVFSVQTLLGGDIPAALSRAGAVGRLRNVLKTLGEMSRTVPAHYGPSHTPIYAPDGTRLPPGLARD